jgi:hypothetical protein
MDYQILNFTIPLIHDGVTYLRIYENGYITDAVLYSGGYGSLYCNIYFLSGSHDSVSYKDITLRVFKMGEPILSTQIENAIPIKTIHFETQTFLIVAQYT